MKDKMNIALWILQGSIASLLLFQGIVKFAPPPGLPSFAQWIYALESSAPVLSAFVGGVELAGAAGLILPGVTGIQTRLTIWAAAGVMILMVPAAMFHFQRGEFGNIWFDALVGVLAALIVYGRWMVAPLPSKA